MIVIVPELALVANTLFFIPTQGVKFEDFVRAVLLFITSPKSQDTFRIDLNNLAFLDGLKCANVKGVYCKRSKYKEH